MKESFCLSPLENWSCNRVGGCCHKHPQRKNLNQTEQTRKHCSSNLPLDLLKEFKRSLTRANVLGWNGKQRNATCCECNQLSDSLQSNNKVTIKGRLFRIVHLYKLLPVRQSETAFLNAVNILCSWPSLTENTFVRPNKKAEQIPHVFN